MIILETSRTNCFVSPKLCSELMIAGLTKDMPYVWKIYKDLAKIHTYTFDYDDYYKSGDAHNDFITPPTEIWPAYSIEDVERILPIGYFMTCNEKGYEISLSSIYQMESCKAERMPDAFALMLLLAIRKRVIDLRKCNLILNK